MSTSARALVVEVHLLDGRYHGIGDWPPSPFRLFSALVAGAYGGRWGAEPREDKDAAFRWLETQHAPAIAVPDAVAGRTTTLYVPNNDIDTVGGDWLDQRQVAKIRGSVKRFAPRLFDADTPILYAWMFSDGGDEAACVARLADRLHALGRGIDMACARAEVVDAAEAEARLRAHGGPVSRPGGSGDGGGTLACPLPGTFASLVERHQAGGARFATYKEGRTARTSFRKPPNPRARQVGYARPSTILLFDLRSVSDSRFHPFPTEQVVPLATCVRDRLLERLVRALPEREAEILRLVKGNGAGEQDKARRLRFLPLPSIGHAHAGLAIRRLAVEIPPDCPLRADDIAWGLAGLDLSSVDPETGEILGDGPVLVPTADRAMLGHYTDVPARRWRTVTPVALPRLSHASGRRDGGARAHGEAVTAGRLADALRHAGHDPRGAILSIQREPFHADGARAEQFAAGRFGPERLIHAEVILPRPISGPLVLGDGRFLGLGLLAPANGAPSIHAFALDREADSGRVVAALRRAVMARVRDSLGLKDDEGLPPFFCGHQRDGAPARSGTHDHLFFALDPAPEPRLVVTAPHCACHREPYADERHHLETLDLALKGFTRLVAGPDGAYVLRPLPEPGEGDRLLGPATVWTAVTSYRPTRHPKQGADTGAFVTTDVAAECLRRGLPIPEPEVLDVMAGRKGAISARLRLRFAVAVAGPIMLGRDSHQGGGLFEAMPLSATDLTVGRSTDFPEDPRHSAPTPAGHFVDTALT